MFAIGLLKSRASKLALPLLLASFCLGIQGQSAQTTPTGQPAPKTQGPPSLSVDRDPVLSPDPDTKPADIPVIIAPQGKQENNEVQKGTGGSFTLRRDVDEVLLNCTVMDDHGHLVRDLKRSDFHIFEDDVPQTTASFQHQDVPVSMGILVDNSGSMRDKRPAVNEAALHLVRDSNPDDADFIVNFSDQAFIDQDLTSNIHDLERGLAHMDSKGGTAMYDAVVASADELANHAKQQKQVLLIITDGEDNASTLDLAQAVRRVQQLQGPVVYSIGLLFDDSKQEADRAHRDLQTLSQETGGIAYFPRSIEDVDAIAAEVARDIRNQYTLGYHSTKVGSTNGYRAVRVEASAPGHGKMTVRTRTGYHSGQTPPPQTAQAAH